MKYLTIIFLLLILSTVNAGEPQHAYITSELNNMLGKDYINKYKILKIVQQDGIIAVFLEPPYREFPNVVLFYTTGNAYKRLYEGLTIGITDVTSKILDLHTVGKAVDFTLGKHSDYDFESDMIRKVITVSEKNKSVLSVYSDFIHMHPMESVRAGYVIDKTSFLDIAFSLYGKDYWGKYDNNQCIMYDSPGLSSMGFMKINNRYVITAETNNKQFWEISFSGLDEQKKYLLNKTIRARRVD